MTVPAALPPPDRVLDCRGRPCPLPVIELGRTLAAFTASGERTWLVAIEADDVAAATDIPAWCRMRGQEYLGAGVADDGVARYLVRLGG